MKEKVLKIIFNIAWISLITLPLVIGTVTMINGANDPWSGDPLNNWEAFWVGAVIVYGFYLWPYIILALVYILLYIIKNRKKKWVKKLLTTIGLLIILLFLFGLIVVWR